MTNEPPKLPDPAEVQKFLEDNLPRLEELATHATGLLGTLGSALSKINMKAVKSGLSSGLTYAEYGFFLGLWNIFDLTIETIIMKELALTPQKASIVCAGLNFGSKVHMLYSLLSLDPKNETGIGLIKRAHATAERNSFTHGFIDSDESGKTILITREVKFKYTVRSKQIGIPALTSHIYAFLVEMFAVMKHFSIEMDDVKNYIKSIADDAKAHSQQAAHHRESLTNARLAKKTARAQHAQRSNPTPPPKTK